MELSHEKLQRLTEIARLYYEALQTQSEIARQFNISRPLVSRLLKQARDLGIVHIEIRSPFEDANAAAKGIQDIYSLRFVCGVMPAQDDGTVNHAIASKALSLLAHSGAKSLGVGFGTAIGALTALVEQLAPVSQSVKAICPLVGNSGVSNRNYHSNEIVRIFSNYYQAYPCYLYAPAFAESKTELSLLQSADSFRPVKRQWETMDMAIVGIGNYPSVPDFACGARYGSLLREKQAAGRLLAYYFDQKGEIITSPTDYCIQAPLDALQKCGNVIGLCASNVKAAALLGALQTGLLSGVIAREDTLQEAFALLLRPA